VAVPRKIRFHDLRHTTATLLLKDGVSLPVVQRILRHSDPRLTTETYGHLELSDMRTALGLLSFAALPQAKPFGAFVVQGPRLQKHEGRDGVGEPCNVTALEWSGRQDLNLRPLGPEGPNADPHGVVPVHLESYPFDNTEVAGGAGSHTLAPLPPAATPFGALVVRGEVRQLLTVREVAARLRVSRATVYGLVQAGVLPALRVSNSIRIPTESLTGAVRAASCMPTSLAPTTRSRDSSGRPSRPPEPGR